MTATATIEADDLDTRCRDRLREIGQYYTLGRELLVAALAELYQPVTIPQILAHEPRLAQSSVYRNLAVLTAAGLTQVVPTTIGDHAYYELVTTKTWRAYGHCARCWRMYRLTPALAPAITVDGLGPQLDIATVVVVATCGPCDREHAS